MNKDFYTGSQAEKLNMEHRGTGYFAMKSILKDAEKRIADREAKKEKTLTEKTFKEIEEDEAWKHYRFYQMMIGLDLKRVKEYERPEDSQFILETYEKMLISLKQFRMNRLTLGRIKEKYQAYQKAFRELELKQHNSL